MIITGNAVTKGQPSPKANFAFLLIDLEVEVGVEWAAKDNRSCFPPQDLRSSNDEVTYMFSNCMPCSIAYSLRAWKMLLSSYFIILFLCVSAA